MVHQALAWWLIVQVIGLIALPITLKVFRRLPGAGYAFAKPLGILLGAYLFWLALSLHLLPNRPGSIVWAFIAIGAVSLLLYRRNRETMHATLIERLPFVLAVEVVFTVALAIAVYLRSFIPEIGGTEKPMDFMLLNTASRSIYYPPADPWLAGFDVSYYYFGYVIHAMLGKLAAVKTSVAFNLGLAGTAALAATAAFGLGYELARLGKAALRPALAVGVGAALFLTVLGNLEGVFEFAVANGYNAADVASIVDVKDIDTAQPSDACLLPLPGGCIDYPTEQSSFWWWWRSTRISPDGNSITEFPFFSFLLGDLHPHVMALPYVLTVAALGLTFWRSEGSLHIAVWRQNLPLLGLSAVAVGGLAFLNTWDLPTLFFLIALLVLARNLSQTATAPLPASRRLRLGMSDSFGFLWPLLALALALYVPFYASFASQASGIDAVQGVATKPLHSILYWGPLVAAGLPLPLVLLSRERSSWRAERALLAGGIVAGLLIVWATMLVVNHGFGALGSGIVDRGVNWLTALFFGAAFVVTVLALWRSVEDGEERGAALVPVLAMMTTAFLLVFGGELFFIRDVFGSRLNTVFKLYYQAWLLLAVSGAFSVGWLLREWQSESGVASEALRGAWSGLAVLAIGGAFLYPVGATLSRTEGLSLDNRTLDGLAFAQRQQRDDFAALDWLKQRAGPGEVVLEATGGQYSQFSRVAAWTGVPTVLGWAGHEVQWGRSNQDIGSRQADVDTAYSTESLAEALSILQKYDVTYIFVGSLERGKYPPAGLQKFDSGLPVVFSSGDSAIYRVPLALADDAVGLSR